MYIKFIISQKAFNFSKNQRKKTSLNYKENNNKSYMIKYISTPANVLTISSKHIPSLMNINHINAMQNIHQSAQQYRRLTLGTYFKFSRKKKQNFQNKFDQNLDKLYQRQRARTLRKQGRMVRYFGLRKFFPIAAFILGFIFFKLHLGSNERDRQNSRYQQKKMQQYRTNITIMPEQKVRQLITVGGVMNYQIQIVRKNANRSQPQQFQNYIFLKTLNGQNITCQVNSLSGFLYFLQSIPSDYKVMFDYDNRSYRSGQSGVVWADKFLLSILLVLLGFGAFRVFKNIKSMMGQSSKNMFDFDNKKIQAIKPQNINTLFKDVAGMHQAKFQITQFVDFLKQPEKYIQMGAKVPKGALLTGPPGTGKTLLARACAGQAGVPFYYVSGSDFVEKYVGLGASRVRKLFDEAQKNAPSIIFIDQIDAIGKKRDSGPFANQQRDNTLNQLLVRMDGFDSKNKVIVMAATNIKDTLDPALLRPGRFDRAVQIGLPSFQQRKQILQVHLKKVKFDPKFTIQQLANRISILTPGFSGAELANVCNQGAILAARQGAQMIDMVKFEKATQRVMAGLEKRNLFSDEQKVMLAYYQSGKAVVGWFTEGSDPIIKLSILPFSKASKGYSHTIKDQIGLTTKEDLLGKICFYLAGRAAEEHFMSYVTTNGDSDLKRARRIITLLVTKFGMSQKLRHIAFPDTEFVRKPYSTQIQSLIDQQISKFYNESKEKVQKLIKEKHQLIEKLKEELLKKESLNHKQIKQILGDRPFQANENYQKYILEEQKSHQQVNPPIQGEKLEP